jgi:type IV pilus assembly protein PilQ
MNADRRPLRDNQPFFASPSLRHGAMFILPLALAMPVLGQGSSSAPPPASAAKQDGGLQSSGKETFTVQFQDTDILQALQMLSIQGQKNIIAGKGVSGSVTANLFDVTVLEALDVILKANDLRYEEVGNFIYVYTRSDWEEMQQARRKKESRRFTLEYINAKDANEFVQPLISEVGKVSFLGQTEKGVAPDATSAGEDSWAFQAMLVVNDYPENLQAIADLLAEVDTPPMQVLVESTIVSTRVNEDNAFGVDFSIIGQVDFADFTNPLSAVNNLIQGNNVPGDKATDERGFQPADNRAIAGGTSVGRTGDAGGLKVGFVNDNVSAFLRVLDEVTDTMILARPRATALNRQRAQILVGERVGYLSTTQTETASTQTVQYLDTGIKLIFRPFISSNGSIRMELSPSVSEAVLRQVTSNSGDGVIIPDEKTNQITANVRMQDGQTLVLGGLFQEKTTMSRRQVPGLGDIPLLGAAFKGQDDKIERNEIIFLITPTILKDSVITKMGEDGIDFAESVRIGAREGLLPWSREALSDNHNRDALEAMAKGDTEKALYHTESSLRINKNQPEMQRLRSELDQTKPSEVYERDMMKRIIEKREETRKQSMIQAEKARAAATPPVVDPLAGSAAAQAAATVDPCAQELVVQDAHDPAPFDVLPPQNGDPNALLAAAAAVDAQETVTTEPVIVAEEPGIDSSLLATEPGVAVVDGTSPTEPIVAVEETGTSIANLETTGDPLVVETMSDAIAAAIGAVPQPVDPITHGGFSLAAALRTPFGLPWFRLLAAPRPEGFTSSSTAIANVHETPEELDEVESDFNESPE